MGCLYKQKFDVPIYPANLWLMVTGKGRVIPARKSMGKVFGTYNDAEDPTIAAMCSQSPPDFGLFFDKDFITVKNITHETFHLTHRILEWIEANFDADHHEQAAYLNGWLNELVFKELKRRIK